MLNEIVTSSAFIRRRHQSLWIRWFVFLTASFICLKQHGC